MAYFNIALEELLGNEGLYSNDPKDKGGETYKGISRFYNPQWEGWVVIDRLKALNKNFERILPLHERLNNMVEQFYLENYWNKLRCYDMSFRVASEIFDAGVNIGRGKITRIFQQSLNLLNRDQLDYPDLVVDGIMGKKTLSAYDHYMLTSTKRTRNMSGNIEVLLKVINYFQLDTYMKIATSRPDQEVFFYGWVKQRI